jgi:hypothetical protein
MTAAANPNSFFAASAKSLRSCFRAIGFTLLILSLVSITGCGGCQKKDDDKTAAEKEKEKREKEAALKKKRKPDFESLPPVLMPGVVNDPIKMKRKRSKLRDDPVQKEIDQLRSYSFNKNFAKPGHWHDVRFQTLANNFDIKGELYSGGVPGNAVSQFLPIEGTKYHPVTKRPAALPKGQWKTFESSVYLPIRQSSYSVSNIRSGFNRPGGSATNFLDLAGLKTMAPDQHHVIVLTNRPDTYKFLELAATVRFPGSTPNGGRYDASYIVVPSMLGFPNPLPRHSLNWTTIAYLIWDDFDPDAIDSDQQTALVDWLHFGGQLILSGPDCVERLEKSFLADFLPAKADQAVNLANADLAEFNKNWSVPEKNAKGKVRSLQVSNKAPLLGINFQPHVDASFLPGSGDLVVERQLGRGRIVATSFSLNAPAVRSWRSFDSFLSSVLMRRPARKFSNINDPNGYGEQIVFSWVDDQATMREPLLHSSLRYLSRDLSAGGTEVLSKDNFAFEHDNQEKEVDALQELASPGWEVEGIKPIDPNSKARNLNCRWHYGGYEVDPRSGIAGWNDYGGVAAAARSTLQDAAGITPPSGNFVLQLLAGYLLVLVPLNWAFFRMLGRVEWAWVAAPFIAIIGAFVVIRMASLDIGFSRSNTQIALLEIPAEYERGHLTEYSALYTSLSTSYRIELDNASSQALPFPSEDFGESKPVESTVQVEMNKSVTNELDGLQIQSNSTQLVHAEHMLDLGGRIRVKADDTGNLMLLNGSSIDLKNLIIVRGSKLPPPKGKNKSSVQRTPLEYAIVDSLNAGSSTELKFDGDESIVESYRTDRLMLNSRRDADRLWQETFGNQASSSLDAVLAISQLKDNSIEFSNAIMRKQSNDNADANPPVTRQLFMDVYEELNPVGFVTLGKLFDCVYENLSIGPEQIKLYAMTDVQIGETAIHPDSTQTDRQTLIVAHLTHPTLPVARRDKNSVADLKSISDLDRKNMELFDEK